MTDSQIIEFCLDHELSAEQYMIIHLVRKRWAGPCPEYNMYYERHPFSQEDLSYLIQKGILISSMPAHVKPIQHTSLFVSEKFLETKLDNTEMAEELFQAYPATFPIGEGKQFIARTGMDKEKLLGIYLERIGHKPAKHTFVMQQLAKYIRLVHTGKINGHKLSDWIQNEMWDVVAGISGETSSPFKKDV